MEKLERERLLQLLSEYAYEYRQEGFCLASGQISQDYIDCKRLLARADILPLIGNIVLSVLPAGVDAVGGLTMGADPIAISTAYASVVKWTPVNWFSVRKVPKKHGTQRMIEGNVEAGNKVVILEDVVTSGTSTIWAINACVKAGLVVQSVIALVDREEQNGLKMIQEAVGVFVPVKAIFTKSEIRQRWMQTRMS